VLGASPELGEQAHCAVAVVLVSSSIWATQPVARVLCSRVNLIHTPALQPRDDWWRNQYFDYTSATGERNCVAWPK